VKAHKLRSKYEREVTRLRDLLCRHIPCAAASAATYHLQSEKGNISEVALCGRVTWALPVPETLACLHSNHRLPLSRRHSTALAACNRTQEASAASSSLSELHLPWDPALGLQQASLLHRCAMHPLV